MADEGKKSRKREVLEDMLFRAINAVSEVPYRSIWGVGKAVEGVGIAVKKSLQYVLLVEAGGLILPTAVRTKYFDRAGEILFGKHGFNDSDKVLAFGLEELFSLATFGIIGTMKILDWGTSHGFTTDISPIATNYGAVKLSTNLASGLYEGVRAWYLSSQRGLTETRSIDVRQKQNEQPK